MKSNFTQIGLLALFAATLGPASSQVQGATTLPSSYKLPAASVDTTKPGFLVRTWKSPGQPNSLAWTEDQLAGLNGPNEADVSVFTNNIYGNSYFDETGVFDYWGRAGEGNFPNNGVQNTPGLLNDGSNEDNYSIEAFTILDLPAGTTTMGVNSDDGFRVYALQSPDPRESFVRLNLGQYDGGRGVADTTFDVTVAEAGFYSFRLIYEEGGGDSAVEWFTVAGDASKHLINDVDNDPAAIKAYRVGTASLAVITKVKPLVGSTTVAPNAPIEVSIVDGATPIDPSTVKLTLDSTPLIVTPAKVGNVTSAKYTPSTLYGSGSTHNVSLTYTENGNPVTANWSFTVVVYASIPASAKVTPDTTKPGFVFNVFQNDLNQVNSNARAAAGVAGQLVDTDGVPLPNLADPTAKGIALANASPANPAQAALHFEIGTVINLSQTGGESHGAFPTEDQMPGFPGGDVNGIAAEIITYLELPAGLVSMGVNSDDGFKTTLGLDAIRGISLGAFDGGRGALDTIFYFFVPEAGVYPFRTLYEEGGGDANIEWFTLKADGVNKVLVNNTANGGLKAYRAVTGTINPYVKYVSPGLEPRQLNQPFSKLIIVIADGTNPVDTNSIVLKLDGLTVPITKTREGNLVTVTHSPGLAIPADVRAAELTYLDSTGTFTGNQQWQFRNLKNLVLPAPKLTENFDSYPEDTQPTGWVATNFSSHCVDGRDITLQASESYEDWVIVSVENMTLLDGGSINVAPGQTFNGEPVTSISSGNVLYAESDGRCNTDAAPFVGRGYAGQAQFITSKPFDCSQITNVVITLSALYTQNQDSLGAIEYSVDGGGTWLPVVYFLDQVDIVVKGDGTIDAVTTFTRGNADTANWVVNGVAKGDNYGAGIAAPITAALGDYIAPRIDDNQTEGARIEVFRLAQAGRKSDVRLRFAQLGTDSWWFAVDNIAFYEGPATVQSTTPKFNAPTLQGGNLVLSWSGSGTLQQASSLTGTWSTAPSQANPQNVPATGSSLYFRISQ